VSGKKRTGMELFDDLEKLSDVVDAKVYFFEKLGRGEWQKGKLAWKH
jgi:hypothetical protein